MPLQKLQFRPGINREGTTLANEGGWFESDKIRFRSGYPEKIGGWVLDEGSNASTLNPSTQTVTLTIASPCVATSAFPLSNGEAIQLSTTGALPTGLAVSTTYYIVQASGTTFKLATTIGGTAINTSGTQSGVHTLTTAPQISFIGTCRSMWNWLNLSGYNLLALGTNLKYYIQNGTGGAFYDVTPLRNPSGTAVASNAFTTTASSATGYVTVVCNVSGHGAQNNDFVTISSVGGAVNGIPAATLAAEYQITYISSDQFSINVYVSASVTAGTTGAATFTFQISTGNDVYTQNVGWGAGGWGGSTGPSATTTLNGALATVGNTILAADITAAATTISVATTALLSASGSVLIDSEIITYSGKTATTLTGCTRGTSGTTAATHTKSTGVIQYSTVTINVTSSAAFAAASPTGTIVVDGEIITYTGKGSGTFTGCVRGAAGYVTAHDSGAIVSQYSSTATGWGSPAPASQSIGQQLRLWSQSNFGEDLIFNPRGGAMYYWANSASPNTFNRGQLYGPGSTVSTKSGSFTSDSSCPSVVNFILVSDSSRFVIAFGTNELPATKGGVAPTTQNPLLIRWSDQENPAVWYPEVTNQAGSYQLSHGSQIITAIQTRQEILVLTDSAIYSMQYLGPPYVWGFQLMGDNISIASPNAVATVNNITYWMGADKFYMYSGRVETLPCALRQYVYDDINLTQAYQFFASTNEGYNEVWWFYCSANSTTIDKYVIFNHLERTWYYGTMARTYWLDSPLRATPMAAGYNGQLIYHENGTDDGTTNPATPIEAYVQSSDFDIGDGHNFGLVTRIIPDVTFDGSNSAAPSLDFTVRPRQFPGTNYGTSDSPTVTSANNYSNQRYYTVQQFTQQLFVRIRGRQMAFKVVSNDLGVSWQLGVPRIDTRPDGRR